VDLPSTRDNVRSPDGRRGILFLSLDIARLPAAIVGGALYRLPYMWSGSPRTGTPSDIGGADDGAVRTLRGT
jgi:uncharacterized protein YqjF (DUF2071 family)